MAARKKPTGELFAARKAKTFPFAFVLDELADLDPETRPMFGCTAVYIGEKIVLVLRGKGDVDDGVWIATTKEHHASLLEELPYLRSITVFGNGESSWRVLPEKAPDFETGVQHICDLIHRRDPRIGKVPDAKKKAKQTKTTKQTKKTTAR